MNNNSTVFINIIVYKIFHIKYQNIHKKNFIVLYTTAVMYKQCIIFTTFSSKVTFWIIYLHTKKHYNKIQKTTDRFKKYNHIKEYCVSAPLSDAHNHYNKMAVEQIIERSLSLACVYIWREVRNNVFGTFHLKAHLLQTNK